MSPRTVTGVGLTVLIASVAIVSLVPSGSAGASKGTCGGATVTISWRDAGVGTHITGTKRPDVIQGGPDDETIDAGAGNDVICAGGGDDQIGGGPDADRMLGEGGDDTFVPGTGDDIIDGGPNSRVRSEDQPGDLVSYDGAKLDDPCDTPAETDFDDPGFPNESCSDELNAFLLETRSGPPHSDGAGGRDLFTGVESLRGMRDFFNFLEGNSGPNVLIDGIKGSSVQGHEGNDLLFGRDGPDVLTGDEGDDFLDGGGDEDDAGSDLLNGGDGTDICVNANPDFVSDCEADAGCPVATKGDSCGGDVKFSFRTKDGLPDKPDDKDLPESLLAIEAAGSGETEFDPGLDGSVASGTIEIVTTHTLALDERKIVVKIDGDAYYVKNGDVRRVDFHGYVTSSRDRSCDRGTDLSGALAVEGNRAALRLNFADEDRHCLSFSSILWKTRNMENGSIKVIGPPLRTG
jgi:hypothetical protein